MSRNRVIGRAGAIPWHLPEDFKWFKRTTMGHVLVMGRKTFESIGRVLPGRETVVLSRREEDIPGVRRVSGLEELGQLDFGERDVFICGGAEVYAQALGRCSDLYLTLVKREVEGDAFFPVFEQQFGPAETVLDSAEFSILHYRRLARGAAVS